MLSHFAFVSTRVQLLMKKHTNNGVQSYFRIWGGGGGDEIKASYTVMGSYIADLLCCH